MNRVMISWPHAQIAHIAMGPSAPVSLGARVRESIIEVIEELDANLDVRAAILTGSLHSFCAGDDLREAKARSAAQRPQAMTAFLDMIQRIESCRVPLIAAINGHCIGGGLELALACDLRIACSEASFSCAGVKMGLSMSSYRLSRIIGPTRAKLMLFTGRQIDAQSALQYGLISAVHSAADLGEEALLLASQIADHAPLAVEATKRLSNAAFDHSVQELDQLAIFELEKLVQTADYDAALAAFEDGAMAVFARR
jgi:enoyl-CoA hydratase/carnithine racemase